ncbi:unnamed protein product, partial [Oppiella nova]
EYLDDKQNLEKTFKEFKYEFNKSYESSEVDGQREQIFRDNMLRVYGHNLKALDGKYSYTLRVGVDADLTPEEFRQNHTRCPFALNRPIAHNESKSASVDSHTGDKRGYYTLIYGEGVLSHPCEATRMQLIASTQFLWSVTDMIKSWTDTTGLSRNLTETTGCGGYIRLPRNATPSVHCLRYHSNCRTILTAGETAGSSICSRMPAIGAMLPTIVSSMWKCKDKASNKIATLLEYLDDKQNLENSFKEFKIKFSESYESSEEDRRREQIFRDNVLRVYGHNLKALDGKYSYTLRVNEYADLTPKEFRERHMNCTFVMKRPIAHNQSNPASADSHTDDKSWSFDWRHQGVIGPVQDQGSCGSCALFAMAALVESYWARSGHGVTTLSTQQMLDCKEGKGICNRERESKRVATIGEVSVNYPKSQDSQWLSLMSLVRDNGPAYVGVHASIDWPIYSQGVLTHQCEGSYRHAVLVVGYGYDKELDRHYWIVKNSWGDDWGEGGYIRLPRNATTKCPLFDMSIQLPYNTGQSPGPTLTALLEHKLKYEQNLRFLSVNPLPRVRPNQTVTSKS